MPTRRAMLPLLLAVTALRARRAVAGRGWMRCATDADCGDGVRCLDGICEGSCVRLRPGRRPRPCRRPGGDGR